MSYIDKTYLRILVSVFKKIDDDPEKSMMFFTTSVANTNEHNKPPQSCRWDLLLQTTHTLEHTTQQSDNCDVVDEIVNKRLQELNNLYQLHQDLCWVSHSYHFHETFENYVNCPITCLCEISEFLTKLGEKIYAK